MFDRLKRLLGIKTYTEEIVWMTGTKIIVIKEVV